MLFRDGPKGNKFGQPGVGENNIDSPFYLSDSLVETIKVGQFSNISLNARNVAADCLYGLVEFLLAAARDEDKGTLFDEKLRRSQPNSFCAAGDDRGLAFELFGHCLSPLLLSCKELSTIRCFTLDHVSPSVARCSKRATETRPNDPNLNSSPPESEVPRYADARSGARIQPWMPSISEWRSISK